MRHQLLVLLGAVVLCVQPALAQESRFKTIDKGSGTAGDAPTAWEVSLADTTHPGEYLAVEVQRAGGASVNIAQRTAFYFAGIDGRTLHFYVIESRTTGQEVSRLPLLLPLGAEDSAILVVKPAYAPKAVRVKLTKNPDNSLTAAVEK